MSDLSNSITDLKKSIDAACDQLKIAANFDKLRDLRAKSESPDFWTDAPLAQSTMKEISSLQDKVQPWQELQAEVKELVELARLNDPELEKDIGITEANLRDAYEKLKSQLAFSGAYDNHNVILTVHAGAGGTDAQDWAQILLRMYTRWAEKQGAKTQLIEQSIGDEAGIKSATLEINTAFAFGKLKGEHGVHRLVRLSPFNSDNLRQTSFAKVDIMPEIEKPNELELDDKDLKIDVYRSGGHGGQSVNTTDSAVRITHLPTGITVSIQNERSQLQNKETALTILRSRLAQLQLEQHQDRLSDLKGPNKSAEWGNQIRSYVLHPYKQVKDLRTHYETSDPQTVLDGSLDDLIKSYTEYNMGSQA